MNKPRVNRFTNSIITYHVFYITRYVIIKCSIISFSFNFLRKTLRVFVVHCQGSPSKIRYFIVTGAHQKMSTHCGPLSLGGRLWQHCNCPSQYTKYNFVDSFNFVFLLSNELRCCVATKYLVTPRKTGPGRWESLKKFCTVLWCVQRKKENLHYYLQSFRAG